MNQKRPEILFGIRLNVVFGCLLLICCIYFFTFIPLSPYLRFTTARALHRILEWKNHGVKWYHHDIPQTQVLNLILKRINEASVSEHSDNNLFLLTLPTIFSNCSSAGG